MSLILDALRKADAERERGSVPGLHSQPVVPLSAETPKKPASRPHWLFIAIGVAVGLALAATLVMVGREAAGPAVVVTPPLQPAATAMAVPAPAAPMPGAAPPPVAARVDGAPAAQPAPWPAPEERKTPRADAAGNPQAAAAGAAPAADTTVHSRDQLPQHIRAALPQFTIGGSIYSPNPAGRSLIVNGQLYRERDRLTQDLSLEEIRLKAAVFSFRGYRFEVLF